MKTASYILVIVGVLVVLLAFIGRFVGYNTVSLFGLLSRMKPVSVLSIGNTFILLAVIAFLYSRK